MATCLTLRRTSHTPTVTARSNTDEAACDTSLCDPAPVAQCAERQHGAFSHASCLSWGFHQNGMFCAYNIKRIIRYARVRQARYGLCLPSCSPYAVAILLVATESKGTLNSLVTVLYTDSAIPTPASCTAPVEA